MRRLLALPIAILAITACGGGASSQAAAPASTATPTPTAQSVTIHESEYKIDPSALSLKAGTVTFNVMDDGKFSHDLHIAPKGTANEVAASQRVTAGGMATLTVTLQPGTYDMWCGVGSHRQLGMQGTITVT